MRRVFEVGDLSYYFWNSVGSNFMWNSGKSGLSREIIGDIFFSSYNAQLNNLQCELYLQILFLSYIKMITNLHQIYFD